jgi:hypothetical protein
MVNSLDVKKINNVILVAAQTRIYLLESRWLIEFFLTEALSQF